MIRRWLIAACVMSALLIGCSDDEPSYCDDQDDCSGDEACVSLDPDPSDARVILPTCAKLCVSDEDCSSGCCATTPGGGAAVCASRSFCE